MGASKSKADEENGPHEVWTVLPHHMGGGPHGLGMCVSLLFSVNSAQVYLPHVRGRGSEIN